MEALLLLAIGLFVATHVDTFVALVAFCADARYRLPEIIVGHFLGFLVGLAGAVLAAAFAPESIRDLAFLLGIIPLSMGLWGFRHRAREAEPMELANPQSRARRAMIVTSAGIGLSGENIAVFVPFYLTLTAGELVVVNGLYLLGAGVVLLLAVAVGRQTARFGIPRWIERRLIPTVLTIVGVYVLSVGWLAG